MSKGLIQLSAELRIRIRGKNPPAWVVGDQSGSYFSYYENEHGEQWVAKLDGNILRISGLDIDWEEIELNADQAIAENNRINDQIVVGTLMQLKDIPDGIAKTYLEVAALHRREHSGGLPLAHIMFGSGELLWLASVLNATSLMMRQ